MVPVWLQTVVRSLLEFQRSSYSLPASIEFRKISVGILTTFWYPIAAKIAGVASGLGRGSWERCCSEAKAVATVMWCLPETSLANLLAALSK